MSENLHSQLIALQSIVDTKNAMAAELSSSLRSIVEEKIEGDPSSSDSMKRQRSGEADASVPSAKKREKTMSDPKKNKGFVDGKNGFRCSTPNKQPTARLEEETLSVSSEDEEGDELLQECLNIENAKIWLAFHPHSRYSGFHDEPVTAVSLIHQALTYGWEMTELATQLCGCGDHSTDEDCGDLQHLDKWFQEIVFGKMKIMDRDSHKRKTFGRDGYVQRQPASVKNPDQIDVEDLMIFTSFTREQSYKYTDLLVCVLGDWMELAGVNWPLPPNMYDLSQEKITKIRNARLHEDPLVVQELVEKMTAEWAADVFGLEEVDNLGGVSVFESFLDNL